MEYESRTGTEPSPNPLKLFYDEIPRYFTWQPSSGEWTVRMGYFNTVGRLPSPSPSQKEVFFLRLLLLRVKGATCFRDLKTYNGNVHTTFGQACVARGLTADDKEWDLCLKEAAMSQMPVQLRWLFASILAHCEVKEPHLLWAKYKTVLSDDLRREAGDDEVGIQQAYAAIVDMLQREGKELSKDFPTMPKLTHPLPSEIVDIAKEQRKAAEKYSKANAEQRGVVDAVLRMLQSVGSNIPSSDSDGRDRLVENCLCLLGEGGTVRHLPVTSVRHLSVTSVRHLSVTSTRHLSVTSARHLSGKCARHLSVTFARHLFGTGSECA
ncbi:hypothetical protein AAVH_19339 [Aphelenchoides avenae]|nr:hypothetical protein AAVH_19339 [Aphelenchus avenae]